jgi:hypothetical protein
VPGQEPLDPPTALDGDRVALFGFRGDFCPTPVDFQVQAMTAVPERKRQSAKLFGPQRGEHDTTGTEFQAGKTALQEIDTTGHRRQVDALEGCTSL